LIPNRDIYNIKQFKAKMNKTYKLPLILEPQTEGGYTITCPLLPDLITEADTLEEVVPNVSDALAALIEAYEDLNQPLPTAYYSIRTEDRG
jgi:antitoxin HicB